MNAPRIARALSLDFPAVPDDAPAPSVEQPGGATPESELAQASVEQRIVFALLQLHGDAGETANAAQRDAGGVGNQAKQPRVWQRQQHTRKPGQLCECADCYACEQRLIAAGDGTLSGLLAMRLILVGLAFATLRGLALITVIDSVINRTFRT